LRENTEEEEPIWVDFIPKGALKKVPEKDLQADIAVAYDVTVPLIETQIFLPYLKNYVSAKNVKFVEREINSFDEIKNDFDFIINCSALGSQKLCNDKSTIPVRGQVALIETRTDFPIYLDNEKPLYLVPRKDAMIVGGTYEENMYEEKTEPATIEKILGNAYAVFPELKQQKLIGSWAGLRPYRPTVRVEKENNIIHDYGHGGSGFTIAFGCAGEVVKLIES